MLRITLVVVALTIAAVSAQEAAPEPYSYGYESENHGASESRDPSGKVTGSYYLTDADGRQRRVEYYADETGFHAKVQTNEVGTKSESSADVEVQAAPPTAEQLVYQASGLQAQQGQTQYARTQTSYVQPPAVARQQSYYTQTVSGAAVPAQGSRSVTYTTGYQQPSYGYQANYQGGYQAYPAGYQAGYQAYPAGYGYGGQYVGYQPAGSYGSRQLTTYNNHLPSQYYRSVQTSTGVAQPVVAVGGRQTVSRYSSAVPVGSSGYQASRSSYSSSSSSSSLSPAGTANLLVQKRA